MDSHILHLGGNRSPPKLGLEHPHGFVRPLRFSFHPAIPPVSDPAGKAQAFRPIQGKGSKTHALDIAGNQESDASHGPGQDRNPSVPVPSRDLGHPRVAWFQWKYRVRELEKEEMGLPGLEPGTKRL